MNKPEQRRKSSTGSRRHSGDRRSLTDSIRENSAGSSRKDFSSNTLEDKPKINYQDELVLIFFNNMLDVIVKDWITVPDVPPQICICKEKNKSARASKDFKALEPGDLQNQDVTDVHGSMVSLSAAQSKRKGNLGSKDLTKQVSGTLEAEKRRRSKSGDRSKSPGRDSIDQRSRMSLKRRSKDTSKTESRRSRASTLTQESIFPQTSLDWLLNPPDENVVIIFKNGNRYEGPVVRRLMHGFGKFMWADGTVYVGDFVNGYVTGHGMLQYSDLTVYHGNFCKSLLHGEGVLNVSSTTMLYSGCWKAGQKHGQGWLLYEPGNWYEGEWHEDKRQGMGLRQYSNGTRYKGNWHQGECNGRGTMAWFNNDLYRGGWKNGIMNGYGEYTWNAFLNTSLTFPLENTYQGAWVEGTRDGVGIMSFGTKGGAQLAGTWDHNKKHGPGVVVCGNGKLIERNPLFWCDKPIHLEIEADPGYPVTKSFSDNRQSAASMRSIPMDENQSTFQLIARQVRSKHASAALEPQIVEKIGKSQDRVRSTSNVDKSQPDFLTGRAECSPLHIPIHMPPEQTDFSFYINKAVQKYTVELYKRELYSESTDNTAVGIIAEPYPSSILKYSKWNILSHHTALSRSPKTSLQSSCELQGRLVNLQVAQTETEEKHLRDAIVTHLPNLYKLYHKYATITSPHVLDFEPILIRYFLWQMIRDLNLLGRKYSLVDIDIILMENPGSGLDSKHYPFEKIYFWQFLQIVMTLAWLVHSPSDVTEKCKNFGILSAIFAKFLKDVVYKNTEFTFACSLFEYRDLLPINSVYLLYRSLGEPHTARKFLNRVCTKKGRDPPCYFKASKDEQTPKLAKGINAVPVGGSITYLPNDPPDIGEAPPQPDPDPATDDPFHRDLFALRTLGPKKVVECLMSVCPQVVEDGVVVNMEYPLTFIEFYDTFLMCGFMAVDKVKKREERIRLREERKLKELLESELKSKSASSQKVGKKKVKK